MLFPTATEGFNELVGYTERLVGLYNRNLAEGLDRLATMRPQGVAQNSDAPFYLDLSTLEKLAGNPVQRQTVYLVNMAKVEALDTMGQNQKAVELLDRHV